MAYRVETGGLNNSPQKNSRKVLLHLLIVSVAVIILDITIIALEFSGFHIIQISYKELAYSIKLKLEISILSRLVKFVQARPVGSSGRITTHDELEWEPAIQQAFNSQQTSQQVHGVNEKSEGSRTNHTFTDLDNQLGYRTGDTRQAHPAQELAIERMA